MNEATDRSQGHVITPHKPVQESDHVSLAAVLGLGSNTFHQSNNEVNANGSTTKVSGETSKRLTSKPSILGLEEMGSNFPNIKVSNSGCSRIGHLISRPVPAFFDHKVNQDYLRRTRNPVVQKTVV